MHTPRLARTLFVALSLLAGQGPVSAAAAPPPRVVVSIAPVHGLVAAVMVGVGSAVLLLPAGASPHAHALRPSQLHELEHASLVIWVGEALEPYLARALAAPVSGRRALALMDAPQLRVWPARSGGLLHGDAAPPPAQAAGRHAHAQADPHLWLEPHNARAIVALAARELSAIDVANAQRYADNAAQATSRIDALEREIAARLRPLRDAPYVVFHDAYQGFEKSFGLNPVAVVTVVPGRAPGARRLAAIRERIVASGARCVFAEPQFEPRLIGTIIEGTGARSGVLDPQGAAITPGPDAWFELMRALSEGLYACLSVR